MTPHDDVPAERERDEHVERVTNALEEAMAQHGLAFEPVDDAAEVGATLAALLARQEAPAEGISLSAQLSQAAAWMRVWDECQRLGMDTYGAPSTRTGLDIVLDFIRGRAAPQETREPTQAEIDDACMWYRHDFGLMSDEDAGRLRFTAREWLRAWHKAGARELLGAPAPEEATEARDAMDFCPTCKHPRWTAACQCAPASGEPSGADAVVREALDALASLFKQAQYVREHDTRGLWPPDWACAECRPDSDMLVEGFRCGFHAAKAVLRANGRLPTAPGAPEVPSETLLPCPFCGGEAVRITTRYSENCDTVKANGGQTLFHGVKCIVCGARTSTVVGYRTPGEADSAWNRRATPQEAREDEFDPIDVLRGAWKAAREALGLPTAPEEGAGGMTDTEAKATPLSDAAVARIIEAVEAHCGMGRGAWDMVAARDLVEGFAAVFGADTSRIDADARRLLVARINGVADGYRRAADALRSMALNTGSRALSKRHAIQLAKQLEAAADAIGAGMAADTQTQTEGESDE